MKQFFFDVAVQTDVRYDYQGRNFTDLEQARNFAELVALDLGCTVETQANEVQVRDIRGQQLFVVPIKQPFLIAA
jgi:hypothetical protein